MICCLSVSAFFAVSFKLSVSVCFLCLRHVVCQCFMLSAVSFMFSASVVCAFVLSVNVSLDGCIYCWVCVDLVCLLIEVYINGCVLIEVLIDGCVSKMGMY